VLTWALCMIVIVSALTWGVLTIRSGFSAVIPTRTFATGDVIAVDLDPADGSAVYAGFDSPGSIGFEISYPFVRTVDAECVISGAARDTALPQPERNVIITADGVEWHQLLLIRVPQPGRYELRCTGEGVLFGLGKDLPEGAFTAFMGILAGVLVTATIAVITTVVLVRKRGVARLDRESVSPPGSPTRFPPP
jgi:hypothetical protein